MSDRNQAIAIARAFHETSDELGSYVAAVPWDEIPIAQRAMMANVTADLIAKGIITPGPKVSSL
jgi:hypothetical protein